MKKSSTLNRNITIAHNSFRSYVKIVFLALFTITFQFASSQDFKFQQADDVDKLVVMEAENFSDNTPNGDVIWSLTDSPPDFSGDGAMMAVTTSSFATADDALAGSAILSYKINFTQTGTHYIWARASRTGGGDDSYHAGLDGAIPSTGTFICFHNTTFAAGTWGWIKWSNGSTGPQASVDIPTAGVHVLEIYIRENGFRIDKILLTTSPEIGYYPDSMGVVPDETLAPTGILSPKSADNAFSVYPNPVSDQIRIQLKEGYVANASLDILDISGKLIKRVAVDNRQMILMDARDLNQGVYIIKLVQADKTTAVKKMVKF